MIFSNQLYLLTCELTKEKGLSITEVSCPCEMSEYKFEIQNALIYPICQQVGLVPEHVKKDAGQSFCGKPIDFAITGVACRACSDCFKLRLVHQEETIRLVEKIEYL